MEVELIVMSFTIALISPRNRDLVFCGDGKELALWLGETKINEQTTALVQDDYLKTLALNDRVCIAVGGKSRDIRAFLEKLLPDLPWAECKAKDASTNFADAFAIENGKDLLELSLADCRRSIIQTLNSDESGWAEGATITLGGAEANGPAVYSFRMREGGFQAVTHEVVAYGSPCDFSPSREWPTIDHVVEGIITLVSVCSMN